MRAAYGVWAGNVANAQAVTDLKAGIDPETGEELCGPTYGCGANIAKQHPAAPRDFTGPLWVVGAMVVGGLLRRRRTPRAS